MRYLLPLDQTGKTIVVGAKVKLIKAPSWLIAGLPVEDIAAIEFITGKAVEVVGFDSYGHAELDFTDQSGNFHSIWVEPACLLLL